MLSTACMSCFFENPSESAVYNLIRWLRSCSVIVWAKEVLLQTVIGVMTDILTGSSSAIIRVRVNWGILCECNALKCVWCFNQLDTGVGVSTYLESR